MNKWFVGLISILVMVLGIKGIDDGNSLEVIAIQVTFVTSLIVMNVLKGDDDV